MKTLIVFAAFGLIAFTHELAADPVGQGNANYVTGTASSVSSNWRDD